MSAVAGVWRLADPRKARADGERMLAAMSARAPDGQGLWSKGAVALGHGLLRVATEERQPLERDGLVLSADLRLDNREDLIVALGLGAAATDPALVAAAYRRWGEECPSHLLGDFAFIIWDEHAGRLFGARDHFGVKTFYYHAGKSGFFCASEIKALFASGDVSDEADEVRIADFLVAIVDSKDATLYRDVRRLPPGHRLSVTAKGVEVSAYWTLRPPAERVRADAPEEFKALFTQAVDCRLRTDQPIGAFLSGGLDSSSISVVASQLLAQRGAPPLATLSITFDETGNSERPFVDAVLAQGGFDPKFIVADNYSPFNEIAELLTEQEGLYLSPGLALSRRLYQAASQQGLRVLLDGHGGDEVISYGWGRLHELAVAGRLGTLWKETRGVAAIYGDSALGAFASYLPKSPVGKVVWPAVRLAIKLGHKLPSSPQAAEPRRTISGFLNPDLVARTRLAERYARHDPSATRDLPEQQRHLASVLSEFQPNAFEVLDRTAGAVGVEARYPFYDKRLVEFCLSLPADEKLRDGWTRSILRRGLSGVLPPMVRDRRDKYDFMPQLARGILLHHLGEIRALLTTERVALEPYLNLPVVDAALVRMEQAGEAAHPYDVGTVNRATVLAQWLRGRATSRS